MTQKKYGFIYIWYNNNHNRFYIGSHWGTEDDGYICSSNWMRKSYYRNRKNFKRRILSKIYTNRKDMLIKEGEWLSLIRKEELGKKYYNLRNKVYDDVWHSNDEKRKTVGEKISKATKGKSKSPRVYTEEGLNKVKENTRKIQKLRTYSETTEEVRKKQSTSRLLYFENGGKKTNKGSWKKGQKAHNKGKPMSDNVRQALIKSKIGFMHSEETKKKMSSIRKGLVFVYCPVTLICKRAKDQKLEELLLQGFIKGKPPKKI